jgi:hypothetical protein
MAADLLPAMYSNIATGFTEAQKDGNQRKAGGDIAHLLVAPQNPHLPAAAPAGLLSRKVHPHPHRRRGLSHNKVGEASYQWRGTRHPNLGEVIPRAPPQKNLRAKWRPRHFAISTFHFSLFTGCRGYPCPRRCGTHGGFRIK